MSVQGSDEYMCKIINVDNNLLCQPQTGASKLINSAVYLSQERQQTRFSCSVYKPEVRAVESTNLIKTALQHSKAKSF